ncbi:TetR family transcriptional regulator [Paraburkholderia hospita]|jgi:AcrR family transcriptional regulator|uniref:TetR family transcriptional regulator n=1 Tax=Paraburkholderia hospita TaxID=169430 RepID=UPI0002719C03|nr:TetR family transcriptional regulator [Paraburkholderia hospita]EUC11837.1 regulatory protein TetR [Burkholderia sp. BT03]EUC21347.1 regulatory protein TetR [Burkholderia sp. BT03]SKC95722.1 transcriptional regulator, TetR family [Paraburkholderia hospita]SKD07405.1 transcriptional regulator, TetR family [Paraburkholderia hospita]
MTERKDAPTREKELKLAIFRIERGRAHTKASKLSVSAVAREAGVTASLIHNHYPSIAELIRVKQGASSRQQRNAKHTELAEERQKNAALRAELEDFRGQVAKLATINEMLLMENKELMAKQRSGNVVEMGGKNR